MPSMPHRCRRRRPEGRSVCRLVMKNRVSFILEEYFGILESSLEA
jgi:hypothetical protein